MVKALKKLTGFAIFSAAALAGMSASAMLALQLTGPSDADARPAPAAAEPEAHLVSAKRNRAAHPFNRPCLAAKTEADLLLVSLDLSTLQGIQRAARNSIGINVRLLVALRRTHASGTLERQFLSRLQASIDDDRRNVALLRPGANRKKLQEWLIRNDRANRQLRALAGRFRAPECVAYFGM